MKAHVYIQSICGTASFDEPDPSYVIFAETRQEADDRLGEILTERANRRSPRWCQVTNYDHEEVDIAPGVAIETDVFFDASGGGHSARLWTNVEAP